MDLRYKSPAMRRKETPPAPMDEGGDMPAPAESETMDEGGHEDQGNSAGSQPTTILKKEMGGGKQWEPGQEIVLKIIAVDPETGDMQAQYAPEKAQESEPTDSMEAMDNAMPEEKGGY